MLIAARITALILVAALAAIAIFAGLDSLFRGTKVPSTNVEVESNFRFLAAFFVAAGAVLVWSLFNFDDATVPLRIVAAATLAGGVARLLAIPVTGMPSGRYLAYTVGEVVAPIAIVVLQTVARNKS